MPYRRTDTLADKLTVPIRNTHHKNKTRLALPYCRTYIQGVAEQIERILNEHNIRTVFKPLGSDHSRNLQDSLLLREVYIVHRKNRENSQSRNEGTADKNLLETFQLTNPGRVSHRSRSFDIFRESNCHCRNIRILCTGITAK